MLYLFSDFNFVATLIWLVCFAENIKESCGVSQEATLGRDLVNWKKKLLRSFRGIEKRFNGSAFYYY